MESDRQFAEARADLRNFLRGLGAFVLLYFVYLLVCAIVLAIAYYVNTSSSYITMWFVPFFARSLAATIGAALAITTINHVFGDYPKRTIAIVFFSLYAVAIVTSASSIVFNPEGPPLSLGELIENLSLIFQGIVTCGMLWLYLWPNRKQRTLP